MARKINKKQEVSNFLKDRKTYGRSKAQDKANDRHIAEQCSYRNQDYDKGKSSVKQNFYTNKTYQQCVNEGVRFLGWVRNFTGARVSIQDAQYYIADYMASRLALWEQGKLSAGYLMTERAQLSKLYCVDLDYIALPKREKAVKGRSSMSLQSFENFKITHTDQARFYSSVGLRDFEYTFLSLDSTKIYREKCKNQIGFDIKTDSQGRTSNLQVARRDDDGNISLIAVAHGKHGKSRFSVIHPRDRAFVTQCIDSGRAYEWFNPAWTVPTQACRREYAQKLYQVIAKPLDTLAREQLYCCRDGSGRVFDRTALGLL